MEHTRSLTARYATRDAAITEQPSYNVTIYNRQTQDKPNDADHIGRDGDCGVAVAKGRNGGYKFKLEHKASYLCFMPRIEDSKLAANVYLTKIVVTSNNKIAGTYEFRRQRIKRHRAV